MQFIKRMTFFMLVLITLILIGCTSGIENEDAGSTSELKIFTTVYPLKDFTEKIGAPYVSVESIYPPNVDEHSYEPSQRDMMKIVEADLFFHIGFGLEGFVNKTQSIMEEEGVKVVALGEEIQIEANHQISENHKHEHEQNDDSAHGPIDPHIWIDPIYAKQLAERITTHLSQSLPKHKDHFEKNMNELGRQFDELHEQFLSITNQAKHDTIIVSHAAFNYWELRYNIKQLSVAGLTPSQEPSQKQLQYLIDTVHENNLKYILVEQNVTSRLVDVIADEADLKRVPIHNLATLTEKDIERDEDYFTLMKANLKTLEKALNE